MRNAIYYIIPWTIILLPFLILAVSYSSLPSEILMTRNIDGSAGLFAPKSVFTVLRVPLLELVCALIIEIMRRRSGPAQKSYFLMWTVLLYTVGLKSLLQAIEIVSAGVERTFFYLTAAVVGIGLILAFFPGFRAFSGSSRADWKITIPEIAALFGLSLAYLLLAFVPIVYLG